MKTRKFIRRLLFPVTQIVPDTHTSAALDSGIKTRENTESDREYWVRVLTTIADPVLKSLSKGKLKEKGYPNRELFTHLEAFGRLMAGMAPWLELGPDNTPEGKIREKYIQLYLKGIDYAVDPESPDFMNFTNRSQPLVDTALLAAALVRAPNQLWSRLDDKTRKNLINAMKSTRALTPYYNNWLLFSAMVEATLAKFDGHCDEKRINFAVMKHMEWYKGDGIYGDGPCFHWDYYNSYVIQPLLLNILKILMEKGMKLRCSSKGLEEEYAEALERAQRYAVIQERLISPEGTFPPIGRSITYRFGAFQLLSQIALWKKLPESIKPAQVRCALTAVIKRTIEAPQTFDENGWLRIGLCGHQADLGEFYVSTGSLYLCSVGLLALGLPPEDEFWSAPAMDWTSKKIWQGQDAQCDHALKNPANLYRMQIFQKLGRKADKITNLLAGKS